MKYGIFSLLLVVALFSSCNNDDNGGGLEVIPPRLLADVAIEDDEEIREFLETHFYNYEEFQNPPAGFDYRIKIDTIAGENSDKKPMSDFVGSKEIKVSSSEHLLSEEETDIVHTLYYISARPTTEELKEIREQKSCEDCFPTVADSVFVRYEGKLLNGTSFDASLNNPIWFDLARLQDLTQGFRGFAEGVPNFIKGNNIIDNGDGTVTVEDYGVGLIIMPSGLATFNRAQGAIPQYAPLMFTVDLFTLNRTDHDGDGIPSIEEDVNGNGYLYDDNTDLQDEIDARLTVRFANFQDADDDGDGVSTRNEISDDNGNIIIPYPDSNNDGTPDYLDPDVN
ncbi:FKBP-type peptidyl-prolyl cis-trans isomerase [Flagellimonas onchidii]|uniref:FKBP-type peptidyl-prolyl cis-trans isomerase n=1 Tax=Flagellimonas onchidii TaxID=2562684 RepID=UPI0010A5C77E|nr:FKBP-type peptidyl-prolyl cis-trans isomerase [Allomuricauda onchidii]